MTTLFPDHHGICIHPNDTDYWLGGLAGSCADFDYDQLAADIENGDGPSSLDEDWTPYCTEQPDRCKIWCVKLATLEALFAKAARVSRPANHAGMPQTRKPGKLRGEVRP